MHLRNEVLLSYKQENIFYKYKANERITEKELVDLEKNAWIKFADLMSPCSLVIRHYCLIDLLINCPKRYLYIINHIKSLAPYEIYLEGYSYWLYTKRFLLEYIEKFPNYLILYYIKKIDSNFLKTCYINKGIKYPAPFGDLWYVPIEDTLQKDNTYIPEEISLGTINKIKNSYLINPAYVGLNLNVPSCKKEYIIINGRVIDKKSNKEFKWYTGYKNKYPSKFIELIDMLKLKRLLTITKNII